MPVVAGIDPLRREGHPHLLPDPQAPGGQRGDQQLAGGADVAGGGEHDGLAGAGVGDHRRAGGPQRGEVRGEVPVHRRRHADQHRVGVGDLADRGGEAQGGVGGPERLAQPLLVGVEQVGPAGPDVVEPGRGDVHAGHPGSAGDQGQAGRQADVPEAHHGGTRSGGGGGGRIRYGRRTPDDGRDVGPGGGQQLRHGGEPSRTVNGDDPRVPTGRSDGCPSNSRAAAERLQAVTVRSVSFRRGETPIGAVRGITRAMSAGHGGTTAPCGPTGPVVRVGVRIITGGELAVGCYPPPPVRRDGRPADGGDVHFGRWTGCGEAVRGRWRRPPAALGDRCSPMLLTDSEESCQCRAGGRGAGRRPFLSSGWASLRCLDRSSMGCPHGMVSGAGWLSGRSA